LGRSTGGAAGGRRTTFTARRTTEATAFTRRAAFRTAHALATLPWATTPHHLRDLTDLFLIDIAVTIGIHPAKALFALLLAQSVELFPADLAVTVGVGTFDEFRDARGRIPTTAGRATSGTTTRRTARLATRRRSSGRATLWRRSFGCVLSAGEAGQAQDAEPVEECLFKFHVVRVC
jgi:hypothetical protein